MQAQELRKSVRFAVKDGAIRLLHPVMPPLTCILIDISMGGMRCRMDTGALDKFAASSWRTLLGTKKLLNLEIVAPGIPHKCLLSGDVRHVRLGDAGAVEFGLKFHKPDPMQVEAIDRAIRAYTRQKERHPYQPETVTTQDDDGRPSTTMMLQSESSSDSTRRVEPVKVSKRKSKTLADAARMLWNELVAPKPKAISYRGMKIGEILMRTGRITPKQAVDAYEKARAERVKFGTYLIRERIITAVELTRALSLQTGLPVVDLANVTMSEAVIGLFSHETLRRRAFVPFNLTKTELFIAVAEPPAKDVIEELERDTGVRMKIFLANDEILEAALCSPIFMQSGSAR